MTDEVITPAIDATVGVELLPAVTRSASAPKIHIPFEFRPSCRAYHDRLVASCPSAAQRLRHRGEQNPLNLSTEAVMKRKLALALAAAGLVAAPFMAQAASLDDGKIVIAQSGG